MNVHVFVDDWLLMDIDGKPARYGFKETERHYKSSIKSAKIAFSDAEVRVVQFNIAELAKKEELIRAAFPSDYLVIPEWLSNTHAQIFGVKAPKIEDIYHYFKPATIPVLIPYQISIRAFLKSKGLLPDDKAVIFVDDQNGAAVVTIIDGMRLSNSRRIGSRDMEYIANEIKRCWFMFQSTSPQERPFVLICNNQQWVKSFIQLNLVSQDDALFEDTPYAVLEGLKVAKFGMHFAPPQVMEKEKQKQAMKSNFQYLLKTIGIFLIGVGIYLGFKFYLDYQSVALRRLELKNVQMEKELRALYPEKLISLLNSEKGMKVDWVMKDLMISVPYGHEINKFNFLLTPKAHWQLSAIIAPIDVAGLKEKLRLKGSLNKATITRLNLNKVLVDQIDMRIGEEG